MRCIDEDHDGRTSGQDRISDRGEQLFRVRVLDCLADGKSKNLGYRIGSDRIPIDRSVLGREFNTQI